MADETLTPADEPVVDTPSADAPVADAIERPKAEVFSRHAENSTYAPSEQADLDPSAGPHVEQHLGTP